MSKPYLADTAGGFAAQKIGHTVSLKNPERWLVRGMIWFPEDAVPKAFWVTFTEIPEHESTVEIHYVSDGGTRARIHVDYPDWRERQDAGEIRRCIIYGVEI